MTLPPIPLHLPSWQAPHIAWLASQGQTTRYAVPDGAEAVRADLRGADLSGANLRGAAGIASIGPVGRQRRMVYAVAHDDGPMVQAGCWWGSVDDTIASIESDYADDHAARERYVAAVRAVAALVTQ